MDSTLLRTGRSNQNLFDLGGRVAVVLGGSSGLGREIAFGLASHGADVVPGGRRKALLEKTCHELESQGRRTLLAEVDVRNRASIEAFHDMVLKQFGRVDILVNAAGITGRKPTLDVTNEEWSSIFSTNVEGTLHACQVFHASLKCNGIGRIINIASLGSYLAFFEVAAYCASKSALLSLTKSLACEWASDGIAVNAIAPGVFVTDLNAELLHGTNRGREILTRTPMKRFGEGAELVGAAVLLASDAASFITGQCLSVDGGYLASGVNS